MKFHCLLIFLLTPLTSVAAQNKISTNNSSAWVFIAENSAGTNKYSGKRGTFEISTTKAGDEIALILGQIENTKTKKIEYAQWYVSTSDCLKGTGNLVSLSVEGDYQFESDYVSEGENIAAGIGDLICAVYFDNLKEQEGKGI